MAKKFHLGWFMNFIPPDWESEWAGPDAAKWANGRFYVDMARNLERACFDYIMIEDTVMVADAYGGTMEGSLKNSVFAPKHDPVPLAVLIAASTSRLGVVATMSTSFYPPYLLARIGILMLGSSVLFIPGLVVLAFGATVQAAATGAARSGVCCVTLVSSVRSVATP